MAKGHQTGAFWHTGRRGIKGVLFVQLVFYYLLVAFLLVPYKKAFVKNHFSLFFFMLASMSNPTTPGVPHSMVFKTPWLKSISQCYSCEGSTFMNGIDVL